MMLASGASAPDCSTSRSLSPEPAASFGAPGPPSTLSTVIRLGAVAMCRTLFQKYSGAAGLRPASVTMARVSPWPGVPSLTSGGRLQFDTKSAWVRLAGLTPEVWDVTVLDTWVPAGTCFRLSENGE